MTISDQPSAIKANLLLEVRRMDTLWAAWTSVRARALNSPHDATRAAARLIDESPQRALRKIHEQLRNKTFKFQPQRGVLKKRAGKVPRPIVVAPVTNRIVQRAILETLQSDKPELRDSLSVIQKRVRSPTSVGGLPGRGAINAVAQIRGAIADGASYYIRSDIKDFFRGVKTAELVEWISLQTADSDFADLVKSGLSVELSNINEPEVRQWLSLFPDGEIGVAQGSSLASFLANLALADFDAALNTNGVVAIRYIDDFVILASTEAKVRKAWKTAQRILREMSLEAHEPVPGGAKASFGHVSSGFDFLSYRFDSGNVGISKEAKAKLLKDVRQAIKEGRTEIQTTLRGARLAEPRLIQTLMSLDRRLRGWGDSFRDITMRLEFHQLDKEVSREIDTFLEWYRNTTSQLDSQDRQRALGVRLLADTPPRAPNPQPNTLP